MATCAEEINTKKNITPITTHPASLKKEEEWSEPSGKDITASTTTTTTTTATDAAAAAAAATPSVDHHDTDVVDALSRQAAALGLDPKGTNLRGYEPVDDFEEMGLRHEVLRGVFQTGYSEPSVIQQVAIRPAAAGHDLLVQAQSGTGKTATFSIGALQQLDTNDPRPQVLVLSPTRELASQSHRVFGDIGYHLDNFTRACLIGGHSVRETIDTLRGEGAQVICGTPGRVLHMLQEGALNVRALRTFILDEADEMLAVGFEQQVRDIFQELPNDVQVLLVTATADATLLRVAGNLLRNPVKILVEPEKVNLAGISQYYVDCGRDNITGVKFDVLCDLYCGISTAQSIIFVNTKRQAERLAYEMDRVDHCVSLIHGEMEQREREQTLRVFTAGGSRVLIATDILARGIDVQQVSLVINYDLPPNRANYTHRIGRGGRFGRRAIAINLVCDKDVRQMRDIEAYYGTQIKPLPPNLSTLI
eukprot:UC1_evm1s57